MGKVNRFEELRIYQIGKDIVRWVYRTCKTEAFRGEQALADQMKRAAISIVSNIAEGYERGTRVEFIQFCYIAKGSCGELRAQIDCAKEVQLIGQSDFNAGFELCLKESKMLGTFIEHLKKTKTTRPGDKFRKEPKGKMDGFFESLGYVKDDHGFWREPKKP